MSATAKHGVVGGFPVLPGLTGLLIPADDEDRIVGTRRDGEYRKDLNCEGRKPDDAVAAEERDHPLHGGQFDEDHQQRQQDGGQRAVHDQQHQHDDPDRHPHHLAGTLVAEFQLVGGDGGGAGDKSLDAVGRRGGRHDAPHGIDGLIGQRLALVTGEIDLHVGGLPVGTLRAGRGERIAPEVLDVLDVLVVLRQFEDQLVVKVVRRHVQRGTAFQDDHHRAVGVEFFEHVTDAFHGLYGRCVLWAH